MRIGYRAIVDDRGFVAKFLLYAPIDGVVAGVQAAAGEPAMKRRVRVIQYPVERFEPMHVFGGFCPEVFGAIDGSPVDTSEISRRHR